MNFYEILQVNEIADIEVIEAAYKGLAKKYLPDINHTTEAPQKMKEITNAYSILRDPIKRLEYDSRLERERLKATTDATKQYQTQSNPHYQNNRTGYPPGWNENSSRAYTSSFADSVSSSHSSTKKEAESQNKNRTENHSSTNSNSESEVLPSIHLLWLVVATVAFFYAYATIGEDIQQGGVALFIGVAALKKFFYPSRK